MRTITQRQVTGLAPLQALYVAALIAVSGSSERVRRVAAHAFEHSVIAAIWGFLARHTEARVSWLRLASITHEATRRFLHDWPRTTTISVESMMAVLEQCTHTAAFTVTAMPAAVEPAGHLGVLTLLSHEERVQLLQSVQAALTPAELCVLHAVIEDEQDGIRLRLDADMNVTGAIERLESLLLGACTYTLGTPTAIANGRLAA
ncbi:MAG: hypothetical protein IBJ19_00795 [Gemmatimonadaceae bacterium]|nr:hypothetical protein [Gemmatimonadaceae bacterium]